MITVPCASFARLLVPCFLVFATSAFAQQQSLEMQTGTGGPAGNGPSVANQAVTLRRNTDNPTGNTFVARTPAITVTYSLSAQQYTGLTAAQGFPASTGGNAVVFGGTTGTTNTTMLGAPLYVAQNTFGAGASGSFTSSGGAPTGTGFDSAANAGISMLVSTRALALQPVGTRPATTARVRMADITLAFNQAVDNPIVHFAGLGGGISSASTGQTQGWSSEFDLLTPGLSLTPLSGNAVFSVAGASVNNGAATPFGSCINADEAACGSVRVNGTGITTLLFRLFLNGDGGMTTWDGGSTTQHTSDGLTIGASLNPIADLSIVKTNTPGINGDADQLNDTVATGPTTYRLTVTNTGPDPVSGAVVTDAPGAGLNCPPANAVTITGSGVPAGSFTVSNLTGTGIPLGTLTAGQAALLSFNCTVL